MKAIVYDRYGPPDVLRVAEVPRPTARNGEVLVAVRAASVNAGDSRLVRADPFLVRLIYGGLLRPKIKILGADVAGEVLAVGAGVTRFRPGDEVYGDLSESGFGAFAELVSVPEEALAPKPPSLTFAEAAAVPLAALAALQGLRDRGSVRAGQRVLINGASGGVGSFAVQIARALGAEVTGVCSTRNVEMVRALGADDVVDYRREDITRSGERYDVMLDAAAWRPFGSYRPLLSPGGVYVLVGGATAYMFRALILGPWSARIGGMKVKTLISKPNRADLEALTELIEAGKITPVVTTREGLAEVPAAIRDLEAGHARGKIVVSI
jgi:NADPH:quinone reductase-like Zn-dependent oxidoreductase